MGTYIYSLRLSQSVKTQMGRVYKYKYRSRLSYGWDSFEAQDRLRQFDERVHERLQYDEPWRSQDSILVTVAPDEGSLDGCRVYRQQTDQARPVWYDTDEVSGELVGILRKKSNRYRIRTLEEECQDYFPKCQAYALKHGLVEIPSTANERLATIRSLVHNPSDRDLAEILMLRSGVQANDLVVIDAYLAGHGVKAQITWRTLKAAYELCSEHFKALNLKGGVLHINRENRADYDDVVEWPRWLCNRMARREKAAEAKPQAA